MPRLEAVETLTLDGPVLFDVGEDTPQTPPPDGDEAAQPVLQEASGAVVDSSRLRDGPLRLEITSGDGSLFIVQHQRFVTFGRENLFFRTTTRSYEDLCITPCELEVAAGAYRFAVIQYDARRSRAMELPHRVLVDADTALTLRHKSRRGARIGFYTAMAASVAAGFAVAVLSSVEERDDARASSPRRVPMLRATSVGLFAVGGGFLLGGVLSRDTVEVERVSSPAMVRATP